MLDTGVVDIPGEAGHDGAVPFLGCPRFCVCSAVEVASAFAVRAPVLTCSEFVSLPSFTLGEDVTHINTWTRVVARLQRSHPHVFVPSHSQDSISRQPRRAPRPLGCTTSFPYQTQGMSEHLVWLAMERFIVVIMGFGTNLPAVLHENDFWFVSFVGCVLALMTSCVPTDASDCLSCCFMN